MCPSYSLWYFILIPFSFHSSNSGVKNSFPAQEAPEDAELRLLHHLMENYLQEKQILPTQNRSEPVIVTFDMAFSQLVDLVSNSKIIVLGKTVFSHDNCSFSN